MVGRILYTLLLFLVLFTFPIWVGILLMLVGMYIYPLYLESVVMVIVYHTLFLPTSAQTIVVLLPLGLLIGVFIIEHIKPLLRK